MADLSETVNNRHQYHPCHDVKVKPPESNMSTPQTHQLQVKGMSCQHCVKAITKAIQTQDPQATVSVELPQGQVTVQSALSLTAIEQAITGEGYEVQN